MGDRYDLYPSLFYKLPLSFSLRFSVFSLLFLYMNTFLCIDESNFETRLIFRDNFFLSKRNLYLGIKVGLNLTFDFFFSELLELLFRDSFLMLWTFWFVKVFCD